jgi:hypothetical protein
MLDWESITHIKELAENKDRVTNVNFTIKFFLNY